MGNQNAKVQQQRPDTDNDRDSTFLRTREKLAAWHRYGVDVWDVYEYTDDLGQGHMGQVIQVRRKERGVHNEATRQKQQQEEEVDVEEEPERKNPVKSIKKITKKMEKIVKKKDSQEKLDMPPPKPLAQPPKSPSAPAKSILKKSKFSNPTLAVPDLDEVEDEEEQNHWKQLAKNRSQTISDHAAEVLQSEWRDETIALSSSERNLENFTSDSPKVYFKRFYACKTLLTSRIKDGQLDELLNEIYVLRTLDHPYIIHLYEIYQVKRKIWLITELCTGGDLTSRKLIEPEVALVVEQILRALCYMHKRGVMHRDLKLENILYESKKKDATIRLIDFGLSKTYDRAEVSRKAIGTAYTLSPEIASGTAPYTTKTDMWSLGICAWILLSGDFPFIRNELELEDKFKLNKLINAKLSFGITWRGRGISMQAETFVKKCLAKNPDDRWTAKEALDFVENEWIPVLEELWKDDPRPNAEASLNRTISVQRRRADSSGSMDLKMDDIQRYCSYGLMKKTILMTMAHTMDRNDVGQLNDIFLTADTEDTGTLDLMELKHAILQVNPSMDDETIEKIFKGIDQDQSGQIHYAEFLAALAESQGLVTMDRLAEAFDRIDAEGKGYISHDDLRMVLGKDYDQDIVDQMIKEADFKKNGQVDYEELLRLMFEDPSSAMETVGDVGESLRKLEGFQDIAVTESKSYESK